jgi:hypothetical protein
VLHTASAEELLEWFKHDNPGRRHSGMNVRNVLQDGCELRVEPTFRSGPMPLLSSRDVVPRDHSRKRFPKPSVGEILTAIAQERGIKDPIAVIGYTRMLRGESFVSGPVNVDGKLRRIVPTHMLCGLAPGRSIEDLVQMAGRCTFTGRNVLGENMGDGAKVKILINHRDWDLAIRYYALVDEIFKGLNAGKTIEQMVADETTGSHIYKWSSNITTCMGKRTIGKNT